jgi:hypothetical protein
VLAYHVDYWDYLGWKDPFASPTWTSRQRAYGQALEQDSIYTPEVVVQGRRHCIGSNASSVTSLLQEAPRFPGPELSVSFSSTNLLFANVLYVLLIIGAEFHCTEGP